MEVNIIKPYGFCNGVKKTIEMVMEIKANNPKNKIYIFGMLVHNHIVTKELEQNGIITVNLDGVDPISKLNEFNKDDIVIFPAHGHNKEYERILNMKQVRHYDATCSQVRKCQTIIDYYQKMSQVIFIGKKGHPETEASLSIGKNVLLYDIKEGFDFKLLNTKEPLIVNQTTLSFLEIQDIHQKISNKLPKAIFVDEVCRSATIRQQNILEVPKDATHIIVVGSKESSNTDKIYRIAKEKYQKAVVIKIDSYKELEGISFEENSKIYITSGTSAPSYLVEEVNEYLKSI